MSDTTSGAADDNNPKKVTLRLPLIPVVSVPTTSIGEVRLLPLRRQHNTRVAELIVSQTPPEDLLRAYIGLCGRLPVSDSQERELTEEELSKLNREDLEKVAVAYLASAHPHSREVVEPDAAMEAFAASLKRDQQQRLNDWRDTLASVKKNYSPSIFDEFKNLAWAGDELKRARSVLDEMKRATSPFEELKRAISPLEEFKRQSDAFGKMGENVDAVSRVPFPSAEYETSFGQGIHSGDKPFDLNPYGKPRGLGSILLDPTPIPRVDDSLQRRTAVAAEVLAEAAARLEINVTQTTGHISDVAELLLKMSAELTESRKKADDDVRRNVRIAVVSLVAAVLLGVASLVVSTLSYKLDGLSLEQAELANSRHAQAELTERSSRDRNDGDEGVAAALDSSRNNLVEPSPEPFQVPLRWDSAPGAKEPSVPLPAPEAE